MSNTNHLIRHAGVALVLTGAMLWTTTAQSQVLAMTAESNTASIFRQLAPDRSGTEETEVRSEEVV